MPLKLFVGYNTRPVDNLEHLLPEFEANKTYKDPAKIKEDLANRKQQFLDTAHTMPYTGTFNEVFLSDPNQQPRRVLQWVYHPPESGKPRISVSVRNYLLNTYPHAWSPDTHPTRPPGVVFFGFGLGLFLKILGLECARPFTGSPGPLPAQLWYGNHDYRDMGEAVLPTPYDKRWDLRLAVEQFRPLAIEEQVKWDALLKGWKGPGQSPQKDAGIAFSLAVFLGFLPPTMNQGRGSD